MRRPALLAAACAAAALVLPAAASAATVRMDGTKLVYTAAPGESNRVSMSAATSTVAVVLRVVEPLLPVVPGAGCAALAPDDAACPIPVSVEIRLGNGNDSPGGLFPARTLLDGGSGNDRMVGPGAPARIFGGPGRDRIRTGLFNDVADGGPGNDRVYSSAKGRSIERDVLRGGSGNDVVLGSGRLSGGPGRDRVTGGPRTDRISGGSGNDRLFGAGGADVIVGGPGRDLIGGGDGNDRIDSADGRRDVVGCGPGFDRIRADRQDVLFGCERVRIAHRR